MMNPDTENTDSIDQGFFGHPKGLRTLFLPNFGKGCPITGCVVYWFST